MAVATARRLRADRVAKGKILRPLTHDDPVVGWKMSYPIPPLPSDAGETVLNISSDANEAFPLLQGSSTGESTLKKRKASRSKGAADLRRSVSTPHLSKGSQESNALSPTSDKRRNKLGYHRTSIACSHCRRRKIRCQIPLPDDPQGRCTNCIRLKKECVFYSVDQAAAIEGKSGNPGKKEIAGMGAPSSSSHSSPHISSASIPGSIADDAQAHIQSPQINSEGRHPHDTVPFGLPTVSGANIPTGPYQYANTVATTWAGSPQSIDHFQQRPSIPDSQYWSMSSTPTTSHYNHDPVVAYNATNPSTFNPNFAYSQGGNPSWAPQSRSMSFGNLEGMAQQANYQGYSYPGHPPEPQGSYPVQQHSQYTHTAAPQTIHAPVPHTPKMEGPPRSWNNAPAMQEPPITNAHTPPVLTSSFYQPPQTYAGYDQRNDSNYQQHSPQFYPSASHPG